MKEKKIYLIGISFILITGVLSLIGLYFKPEYTTEIMAFWLYVVSIKMFVLLKKEINL